MAINIENSICEAIEYIVENAVANAGFDKTVQATIIGCVDEATGKYKVKYQDSSFYAYAQTADMKYITGKSVYVLIPGNNMSSNKTILGTVDKLGTNYVPIVEGDAAYEVIGTDCIDSTDLFELCSYKEKVLNLLYDKNDISNSKIHVNSTSVDTYIKQSKYIICGATFQTALPKEQQFKGNYGVAFELNYHTEKSNEEIITKTYTIDVNQMLGSPYTLTTATRQYGIFEIDANKFIDINKIYIFSYDFPHQAEDMPSDIFITNIELSGAVALEKEEEDNDYSLSFITPQGTYFNKNDDEKTAKEIQAQIKIKGKILDNNSQDVKYYWFIENMGIINSSEKYNQYGGLGWECLNNYNILSSDDQGNPINVEWIPGTYSYTVIKQRIYAKEINFKCVAIYNETILSKTIKIMNYGSLYDVVIESDSGTQFYFDVGNPTLTCKISDREIVGDEYTYVWVKMDNNNNFEILEETPEYNEDYNHYKVLYDELVELIKTEQALPHTSQDFLDEYLAEMKKYDKIMRVEQNKLINVQVKEISNFATYKCSVFIGDSCLGTGSITLLNTLKTENGYDIVIENGTQVYKYNENGVAPTSKSLEQPQALYPLKAIVYDNKGNLLPDDVLKTCEIKWIVPKNNTMIQISHDYDEYITLEENDYIIYSDILSLGYSIAENYNNNKTNNLIQLSVTYQGLALLEETNLTFLKEGNPGTNGTDYTCIIVPNTEGEAPLYPTIINGIPNYKTIDNKWFKVQLWHNGQLIFNNTETSNSTEGKQVSISWGMLANKYTSQIKDESDIIIDTATGECQYLGYRNSVAPANIVKCSIVYDNIEYYATLPLITAEINTISNIELKEHTGFRHVVYSADGQRPQYDSANPFELKVWQMIDGVNEIVSNIKENVIYKLRYKWNIIGQIYNAQDKKWIDKKGLLTQPGASLETNLQKIKPVDVYDGECVTNALVCEVQQYGRIVANIHIPVHLSLNRYGLSMLNSWDGNSIAINQNGGYILTPQMGAGKKEDDNSFTGMVMGQVKEANQKNADTGLIAYHRGVRSMYLSAYDGYALFGKQGSGQIALDPVSDKALLYSHDFWDKYYTDTTNAKRNGLPVTDYVYNLKTHTYSNQASNGMLIDLTTPRILFGSGNFRVDPDGYMYAKGGGTIGGWDILDHSLSANYEDVGMSSVSDKNDTNARVYPIPTSDGVNTEAAIAFWAGYENFYVSHDGYVRMNSATIGKGTASNLIYIGRSGDYSSLHSGKKDSLSKDENGFYLGTDGFSLGKTIDYSDVTGNAYAENHSKFEVKKDGTLYAKGGYIKGQIVAESGQIGGWSIKDKYLQGTASDGKYIKINSNGAIVSTNGTTDYWKIDRNGTAQFTNITITGGSAEMGDDFKVSSAGKLTAHSAVIDGKITANEGKVGNWTISEGKLSNGTTTLTADGKISATNVDLSGKIKATEGEVAGYRISGQQLIGNNVGMCGSSGPAYAFWAGSNDSTNAPFRVGHDGSLRATNADITGEIKATKGTFENCVITGSCTVPASTVQGQLASGNIPEISADKISGGTLDGIAISGATISGSSVSGVSVWGDVLGGWTIEVGVENKFKVAANGELSVGGSTGKSNSFWIMTGWTDNGNGSIKFKGRNCTFKNGIITSISDETYATAQT